MGSGVDQDATWADDGQAGGQAGGQPGGLPAGSAAVPSAAHADVLDAVNTDGLTAKQEQGLAALLSHPTVKHAAESINVGVRTMHTWLSQPAFRRAYREARRESYSHAVSLCQRYGALAVQTLAKVMTDPEAPHAAKVAAAMAVLKFGRDGMELDDLADRVELLEQAAKQGKALGLVG